MHRIEKNISTAHIPIIIMSALYELETKYLPAGANAFILNPFELNSFFEKIEKTLDQAVKRSEKSCTNPKQDEQNLNS